MKTDSPDICAEVTWAFRLDMRDMAARGEHVERWPSLVDFSRNGLTRAPVSALTPIRQEILAVATLLEFVGRCRS